MHRRLLLLSAAGLLFVSGLAIGVAIAQPTSSSVGSAIADFTNRHTGADFKQFEQVWDEIHQHYVEAGVNDTALIQGAVQGMVSALGDPYSVYLTPKEAQDFQDDIDGTFEGVGMEVGVKNGQITVIAPLPDSPAEKAGLRAGDAIHAIDELSTTNMNLTQAVQAIRGKKGTVVKFEIQRGTNDPTSISVTRDTIKVSPVTGKMLGDGDMKVADIQVTSFNGETTKLFVQQAREFLRQSPRGFILDLRNDPGGLLDQSIQLASVIVPEGTIVSEVGRDGDKRDFKAEGGAFLSDERIVVLVDGGSASAAEIVAGALQGKPKITIVGEKTFGKGSVQDYQTLDDGSSLKLTIAKWLTPSGKSIQSNGITPDVVVTRSADDADHDRDPQLDKALEILRAK